MEDVEGRGGERAPEPFLPRSHEQSNNWGDLCLDGRGVQDTRPGRVTVPGAGAPGRMYHSSKVGLLP